MPAVLNAKTKKKILIDIAMAVLFIFLMNLAWTGILWHEILSLAAAALLAAHLLINRAWIRNIAVMIKLKNNVKAKLTLTLNMLLGLSAAATFLSGILISEYLFAPLASSDILLWMDIHAISSTVILIILMIHTLFHWRWIRGLIRNLRKTGGTAAGKPVPEARPATFHLSVLSAKLMIVAISLAAVYTLTTNCMTEKLLLDEWTSRLYAVPASRPTEETTAQDQTDGTIQTTLSPGGDDDHQTIISLTPAPTQTEPVITLQEYLSKLRCTGCQKHCLLTNPQCSRGERQAEEAKQEYFDSLETSG